MFSEALKYAITWRSWLMRRVTSCAGFTGLPCQCLQYNCLVLSFWSTSGLFRALLTHPREEPSPYNSAIAIQFKCLNAFHLALLGFGRFLTICISLCWWPQGLEPLWPQPAGSCIHHMWRCFLQAVHSYTPGKAKCNWKVHLSYMLGDISNTSSTTPAPVLPAWPPHI